MEIAQMIEELKKDLKPNRFAHTMGVAETARAFAKLRGLDEDKAYLAGLLHDCAKGYDRTNVVDYCASVGVELDELTQKETALVHAVLGVHVAREKYGVEDEAILSSIRWHTVAKAGMTPLEEIIYLADTCEPNRTFPAAEEVRELVREARWEAAMIRALDLSITHVLGKGTRLHPKTVEARNYYLDRSDKKA